MRYNPHLQPMENHAKISLRLIDRAKCVAATRHGSIIRNRKLNPILMDFESLATYIRYFYYDHTIASIAVGVVLVVLFCFRPKAMFKVTGLLLAFVLAAYLFSQAIDMAGSGRAQKNEMIHKVD